MAKAFNFNVATGLKQEISSFNAAAVSTQDLFYESNVNFNDYNDFNVRYSSDLGVALMSAAHVQSIFKRIFFSDKICQYLGDERSFTKN